MIGSIAIAASVLGILADDERPDFMELFQRAVMFENPEILLGEMKESEREKFAEDLDPWILDSKTIEEMAEKAKIFHLFFPGISVLARQKDQVLFNGEKRSVNFVDTARQWDWGVEDIKKIRKWISSGKVEVIDIGEETLKDGTVVCIRDDIFDGNEPDETIAHDDTKVLVQLWQHDDSLESRRRHDTKLVEIPRYTSIEQRHKEIRDQIKQMLGEMTPYEKTGKTRK